MPTEYIASMPEWVACLNLRKKEYFYDEYTFEPLVVHNKDFNCSIHYFGKNNIILSEGYFFDTEKLSQKSTSNNESFSVIASKYYLKYKELIFKKLKGEYIIAIWDNEIKSLLLGRDGLGRHPLYYYHNNHEFWFSPNLLALSKVDTLSKQPDRLSLSMLIMGLWPENESTSFENIKKTKPGQFIKIGQENRIKKIPYINLVPEPDEPYIDNKIAIEKAEEILLNTTKRCINFEPQGIMLSGGIDSVMVAALVFQQFGKNQSLVACSGRKLPGSSVNYEELMQDKIADHFGMFHIKEDIRDWIGDKSIIEKSLDEISNFAYPTKHYWSGGFMNFWRNLSNRGLNRLLTGSGGDESFGLHASYTADLIKNFQLKKLFDYFLSEKNGGRTWKEILKIFFLTHGIKLIAGSYWYKIHSNSKSRYNRKKLDEIIPDFLSRDQQLRENIVELLYNRRTPETELNNKIPKDYYRHSLRSSTNNGFLDYDSECTYNLSRLAGVSFISPYQDIEAVKLFLNIRPEMFMIGKNYKGILRTLAKKYLPGFELEKQKKLYEPNRLNFVRNALINDTKKKFAPAKLANLKNIGIIDKEFITKKQKNLIANDFRSNYQLFCILSVENWLEKNV